MTMDNDQKLTDDYCASIVEELDNLEMILSGAEYAARRSSPIAQLFIGMAETAGEDPHTYTASIIDYLNGFCLEIVSLGERRGLTDDDWTVTSHKILRTFGGPNCWIEDDGEDSLTVEVYWGGSSCTRSLRAPAIVAQLNELD